MYKMFNAGMIEVIVGPMFSGKSEELLKRIRTLEYAGFNLLVVKPSFDTRYGTEKIVSRAGTEHETHTLQNIEDIYELMTPKTTAIIIDEAQFFSDKVVDVADDLANKGYLVIVSGLDQDFRRKPFDNMAKLMAISERVTKLQAVCVICKNAATCSYRTVKTDDTFLVDDENSYEARCRKCHNKGMKETKRK